MIDKDRDMAIRIHSVVCFHLSDRTVQKQPGDVKDFKRCRRACSKLPTVYARGAIDQAIDSRLASARLLLRLTSYSRSTQRATY